MSIKEDKYYIEKVMCGDTSSYSFLVDRHKGMVFTLALRMLKNREDAEETAQDAFLKAFNSLSDFKWESSFSTWLYRIVYNLCVSKLRASRQYFDEYKPESREYSFDESDNALKSLNEEDQKRYINLAISKLDSNEGVIITLYYLNENTINEIREITGLSSSNIKIKLFRARKKLLTELTKILKEEVKLII